MFDRILIAKIGWADHYQDDNLSGFDSGDYYERFNFRKELDGRFYGAIPGIKRPNPDARDGWLILFISREIDDAPYVAVGWYENATFEQGERPSGELSAKYGKKFQYSIKAASKDAHLICSKLRALFPAPNAGVHFGNTNFVYVRDPNQSEFWHRESWRKSFAEFAESVASGHVPQPCPQTQP